MIATIAIQSISSKHQRFSPVLIAEQDNRPTNEVAQSVVFDLSRESVDPFGQHREYFQGNDYY
ncbi:MAG: hypothetical protein ACI906_003959 [Candidatus Latescibacterota bacterium]|jgi:hypothetical protein